MEFVLDHWLAVLTFLIQCGVFKFLYSFIQEYRALNAARDNAVRSLLRSQIITIYHKAEKEGFLPIYNLENVNDMFKAYKTLGGNGAIENLYNQLKTYSHRNPPTMSEIYAPAFERKGSEGRCEGCNRRECDGQCEHKYRRAKGKPANQS